MSGPSVFVNYRREGDVADATGRIYDRLVAELGRDRVFKDVDDLTLGEDFEHHIRGQLQGCQVFLAVIGPKWLTVARGGTRRLDLPDDWVRKELEIALGLPTMRVVPVLVNGAHLPAEAELPPSIRALAGRQAETIGHNPRFHTDMERLLRGLQRPVEAAQRGIDALAGQRSTGEHATAGAAPTPAVDAEESDPRPGPGHPRNRLGRQVLAVSLLAALATGAVGAARVGAGVPWTWDVGFLLPTVVGAAAVTLVLAVLAGALRWAADRRLARRMAKALARIHAAEAPDGTSGG